MDNRIAEVRSWVEDHDRDLYREVPLQVSEIRDSGNGIPGSYAIKGLASVYSKWSLDLGGFRERIAPGSFAKTIQSGDIRCLWNHDANIVLGRNKSGTLRMSEDSAGLYYECDAPETQLVNDMVMSPISRGDVNQCSFGFRTISDKWAKVDGEWLRTLLEVELFDVSPVTYPAYASTDVAVRSLRDVMLEQEPSELWRLGLMARRLELEGSL
jgi:HK97 family phage prohead protease